MSWYNERKDVNGDSGGVKPVVRGCAGKRLTYMKLTGKA